MYGFEASIYKKRLTKSKNLVSLDSWFLALGSKSLPNLHHILFIAVHFIAGFDVEGFKKCRHVG